jgi:hypothetical protein
MRQITVLGRRGEQAVLRDPAHVRPLGRRLIARVRAPVVRHVGIGEQPPHVVVAHHHPRPELRDEVNRIVAPQPRQHLLRSLVELL